MADTLVRIGFAAVALCGVAAVVVGWVLFGGMAGAAPWLWSLSAFMAVGVVLLALSVVYDFD